MLNRYLLLLLPLGLFAAPPAEEANLRFFRDLAETRSYSLGRPVAPKLTPDGTSVIFLRGGPRDPVLRLYELDVATGRERELITPAQLLGGGEESWPPRKRPAGNGPASRCRGLPSSNFPRMPRASSSHFPANSTSSTALT